MKLSKAERALFKKMGRRGGKRRAAMLTPEQRKDIASQGGLASVAVRRAAKQAREAKAKSA